MMFRVKSCVIRGGTVMQCEWLLGSRNKGDRQQRDLIEECRLSRTCVLSGEDGDEGDTGKRGRREDG